MKRIFQSLVLGLALMAAGPVLAAPQYYGFTVDIPNGETVLVLAARTAGEPDESYDYQIWAVRPSYPEGRYFVVWSMDCQKQLRSSSSGFMPWDGGQEFGNMFEIFGEELADGFAYQVACDGDFPRDNPIPKGQEQDALRWWLQNH
ncbi:MAG: hypothetical protein GC145_17205 [Caulobacter sp.]|nr:hypothetical protein [Caulobacter sp.]